MKIKELIEELKQFNQELEVVCLSSEIMDWSTMTSCVGFGEVKMHVPEDLRKCTRFNDPVPNGTKVFIIYGVKHV